MNDKRIDLMLAVIGEYEEEDFDGTTREERQWMKDFKTLAEAYKALQYRTEQT